MPRISLKKQGICYNPDCKAEANYSDLRCYLDPGNDNRVFCSFRCGEYYLDHIDEIEQNNRLISRIKERKSRKKKELAQAMQFYSGNTWDLELIKKVIDKLDLESRWV